jgi:hypothetical protein
VDIPELNMATFQTFHSLPVLAPHIDVWFMFQEASYIDCSRDGFSDIGSERKELSCSLGAKHHRHQTDEKLRDRIFALAKESASIPEQQCLRLEKEK